MPRPTKNLHRGHTGGSVKCSSCGTAVGSQLALMSHEGSKPCKLAATQRRMQEEGWKVCTSPESREVLSLAELEHEEAPAAYGEGGMHYPERTHTGMKRGKVRFEQPWLEHAIWCPSWAQPLVDESRLTISERARVIRYVMHSGERIAALQTMLALGGIEALKAYAQAALEYEAAEALVADAEGESW